MSFPGNGQQPTFKHSLHLALEVPVEAPFWGKALIGIVYACIIANEALLRGLVLDEVVSSNMIESVHSTRRQIKDTLNALDSGSAAQRRFNEFATLYLSIVDGTALPPTTPEDVRSIYDKVMSGELSEKEMPDGKLFRAESVNVVSRTRVIHRGLVPEERIIDAINAMLDVASKEEIPTLYGAIASHYLFEYAHPFYDGNGRTGRYLLALYLHIPLSSATSLSLSRTIAENKNDYYRAFETAQNPLNHGELTHFVFEMLRLINLAQEHLLERLDASEKMFDNINNAMEHVVEENHLKSKEQDILYMLMQYEAFRLFGDAPLTEIAKYLGVGNQMARRYLSTLESHGLVQKARGRNPLTFALTESFKSKFGIAVPEDDVPTSMQQ